MNLEPPDKTWRVQAGPGWLEIRISSSLKDTIIITLFAAIWLGLLVTLLILGLNFNIAPDEDPLIGYIIYGVMWLIGLYLAYVAVASIVVKKCLRLDQEALRVWNEPSWFRGNREWQTERIRKVTVGWKGKGLDPDALPTKSVILMIIGNPQGEELGLGVASDEADWLAQILDVRLRGFGDSRSE